MMAGRGNRITAPELEQFIVNTVQLTGEVLGTGAYGNVEEVKIPGARIAAKKLHAQLVDLGSPQQVRRSIAIYIIITYRIYIYLLYTYYIYIVYLTSVHVHAVR